jgi:hypothetical protein
LSLAEGALAMTSTGLRTAEQQYIDLMAETRTRLLAIEAVTSNQIGLPAIVVRDFGYIELRMLCEVIALACLIAHGDLAETKTKKMRD